MYQKKRVGSAKMDTQHPMVIETAIQPASPSSPPVILQGQPTVASTQGYYVPNQLQANYNPNQQGNLI